MSEEQQALFERCLLAHFVLYISMHFQKDGMSPGCSVAASLLSWLTKRTTGEQLSASNNVLFTHVRIYADIQLVDSYNR